MKTILLYPEFADRAECANVFSRVLWYFSPYDRYVAGIQAFGPFPAVPTEIPAYIDPAAIASPASQSVQAKVAFAAPPSDAEAWAAAIEAADMVLVWQTPEAHGGDAFGSLKAIQDRFGKAKVFSVDEQRVPTAASNMMSAALSLIDDEAEMMALSQAKLAEFKQRIEKPIGYVFGTGPSLEEAWRYDYSDGHTIVCNSIVRNAPLLEKLNPIALMAGDPIFHAGPSTYAMAFRESLRESMAGRDFHLFVPWRDYGIYLTYLPEEFHRRIIGVPLMAGDEYNLNIEERFQILALPNVLTLLLLPVAATFFQHVGISGCDGRPLSQDSYFWGHHKASQFGDQMEAIQRAHPSFFSISYNDYYLKHCAEVERVCREMEKLGKTVEGVTGSFIPALRKRGAAEPMHPPRGEPSDPPVVVSLAPDLTGQQGEAWAQERMLAPKVEAGGVSYRVAANVRWKQGGGQPAASPMPVSASLTAFSATLGGDPEAATAAQRERAVRELRTTVEGALLATPGRLHAIMRQGSLEHAALLYELSRENPRFSAQVTLYWLRSADIWTPDFLRRWKWLLRAALGDPRLRLACTTEHQRRELEARSGISLPVAANPSTLVDDEQAWQLLNAPRPPRDGRRIFLPAGNGGGTPIAVGPLARSLGKRQAELVLCEGSAEASGDGVTVLPQELAEEDLLSYLRSSDAVVLPYLPPHYADHHSGMAVDALYAGAAIVALRGTSLAQMAERYRCGVVIDEGRPEEVAAAIDRVIAPGAAEKLDIRQAGLAYFRKNSWHRLAQDVIDSMPTAESGPMVPASAEEDQVPVPLVGPVPRSQQGRADPIRAVQELLNQHGVPLSAGALPLESEGLLLQFLLPGKAGIVLAESEEALPAVAQALQAAGTPMTAVEAAAGEDGMALARQLSAIEKAAEQLAQGLLVSVQPRLAGALPDLLGSLQPLAAVIAYDDALGGHHGDVARDLDALGYLVLVVEQHPRLHPDEPEMTWRIAAYPFVSDLPWSRGQLIALPPEASLFSLKQLLLQTGTALGFEDQDDPARRSQDIWARAPGLNHGLVLTHAAAPGELWRREAFLIGGPDEAGLAYLEETDALRVHRTFVKAQVPAGKPLTFSVDCAQAGRRFITLWLSDKGNKPRAEATFDLDSGLPVGTSSQLEDPTVMIEAGGVEIGRTADERPLFRLWISVLDYPQDEEVHAQLLTRAGSGGSKQHKGEPGRGVIARDMLMELTPIPSKLRAEA